MTELKLPRLLAAAKEFNVGQDTIVDFLAGKGFNRDDLKPTAKLNEDMYRSLQHQFQGDKVAKNKADLVEIPKGMQQEGRRKRDEEEITFNKKDLVKPAAPQQVQQPVPETVTEPKKPEPVAELQPVRPVQEIPVQIQPEPIQQHEPVKEQLPVEIQPKPAEERLPVEEAPKELVSQTVQPSDNTAPDAVVTKKEEDTSASDELQESSTVSLKIEAPEIEGPKIISKIDLSSIDSSTRPKKSLKKPEQQKNILPEPIAK